MNYNSHEHSPDLASAKPCRREHQAGNQLYSVCEKCNHPIVRFNDGGIWVISTAPHHPYKILRPQTASGF